MLMSPSMYPPVFLPANTSIRVVLPAPLTPISAVNTPGLKDPLTPLRSSRRSSTTPCTFISCGMSTEYLMSSKVSESGTNGRIIPF
uniref:Uncharacterized protein n=1 Tax=Arundo donax TaxID=35708 RepID=A0A0A8XWR3_ARUDO